MTKDYQVLYIHPRKMEIHGNIQYLWKTKDCQILYIHLHKRKEKSMKITLVSIQLKTEKIRKHHTLVKV